MRNFLVRVAEGSYPREKRAIGYSSAPHSTRIRFLARVTGSKGLQEESQKDDLFFAAIYANCSALRWLAFFSHACFLLAWFFDGLEKGKLYRRRNFKKLKTLWEGYTVYPPAITR
jgi:hypothetical protein